MISGAFKSFEHKHYFSDLDYGVTLLTDVFDYDSPFGIFGRLMDKLILKDYMTELLEKRNRVIKEFSESEKWKKVLSKL